jgi:single stranded DNA-binding protein
MTEPSVSFAGNLTDDPELRHTESGVARARFRVAISGRREQEASFFTVVVWRDQAEHAAQSLAKGSRVVVVGRLQQRNWTAADGSARSVIEVVAEELGGRACGGRRRRRPGRRGARSSSQLGQPYRRRGTRVQDHARVPLRTLSYGTAFSAAAFWSIQRSSFSKMAAAFARPALAWSSRARRKRSPISSTTTPTSAQP